MHSKAKEDKCRVCSGNGENCRGITGKFHGVGDGEYKYHLVAMVIIPVSFIWTSFVLFLGYKEFVVIPVSATNIVITEDAPAGHFLGKIQHKVLHNVGLFLYCAYSLRNKIN